MGSIKFRFPEEAHTKYGADWYELDFETIERDVDSGILERFEDETGFMALGELPDLVSRGSFRALRAVMWLTFLISGKRIKWAVFKADNHTDPRLVEWNVDEDSEGEQSSPPPPNRAARRASKVSDGSSAT